VGVERDYARGDLSDDLMLIGLRVQNAILALASPYASPACDRVFVTFTIMEAYLDQFLAFFITRASFAASSVARMMSVS
jgi:hypothetical protein